MLLWHRLVTVCEISYNIDMKIQIKNTMKKENLLYARLFCLLAFGSFISGAVFVWKTYSEYEDGHQYTESIKEHIITTVDVADDEDANLARRIDFDSLLQRNPEVGSWLYVPDTAIDGVVMQESVVGEYKYDKRNMDGIYNGFGSYLIPATPIVESTGKPAKDAHTLVLAHRMHNYNGEWQFSNVPLRWGTLEGANAYPYAYMYYPDRAERWRVWSAGDAHGYDMIYKTPYELGSEKYGELLAYMAQSARYTTDAYADFNTPTLVLSTCNNEKVDEGRYFVAYVPDAVYYYDSDTISYPAVERQEKVWKKKVAAKR